MQLHQILFKLTPKSKPAIILFKKNQKSKEKQ
jgi:hypothetical protein